MTARLRRVVEHRWLGPLITAALLLCTSLVLDPGGYLGTDTGGKVATLEVMVDEGSWSPDVGYWAEELDPTGQYHPLFGTRAADDSWIQVTTLPMIYAARPLYDLGGYRLALLLPILGTIAAAMAARALADRLGAARPELVFWLFALASPLLVYALDLWEHSLGVALMSWAFVLLLDVYRSHRPPWVAAGAGALLAGAATMRTEALVYAFVMVGVVCIGLLLARRFGRSVLSGTAVLVGFAPVWVANSLLERTFDAPARTGRARGAAEAGVVASTGGRSDELELRVEEALRTLLSVGARDTMATVVLGALLLIAVAYLVRARPTGPPRSIAIAMVIVVYVVALGSGLGFVNGLLPAFPVAGAAVALDRRSSLQVLTATVAVSALPLVWAFQFVGGAGPQWGGRYILESGFLLGVLGAVVLWRSETQADVRRVVVGASVAVSLFGALWLVERSHGVDDGFDRIQAVDVDGIVAANPFILREGGSEFIGERWLSANSGDGDDVAGGLRLLGEAGAETGGVLQEAGAPPVDGFELVEAVPVDFLGVDFEIAIYDLG